MATTEATLSEEIEVDWADLPADMLRKISKKLHDIAEFILFRAVCKRWRTATSISDPPPLIPWLLEEPDHPSGVLRFYSLFSDKVRTVPCPQYLRKSLSGASHGYLCATDTCSHDWEHSLLNPLTKDEVTIPFPNDLSCPDLRCMGPDPIKNDHMVFRYVRIDTDEDENENDSIGFYQPLSREWSFVEVPGDGMSRGEACLNGLFYMDQTETTDVTRVVDIASGTSYIIPPPPETRLISDTVSFVESAGKILRIVKKVVHPIIFFDLYELDVEGENGQARWVKTSCIGDQVLFLHYCNGISVTASESTGLKGNCIYYLDEKAAMNFSFEGRSVVCRFNLEDGRTERIPCPFNKLTTWFVPSVTGSLSDGLHKECVFC